MKIIEKMFDITTGEETISEREETADEKIERQTAENEVAQVQAETQAKSVQRLQILERLGITEEEAKLLLG